MCTVTFLPLHDGGFVLTSNRDEKIVRAPAQPPRRFSVNNHSVFFPKDPHAGGTWIATSGHHFTLCLLNGGHTFHQSNPPYRLSRGQVLLDFFHFSDVERFVSGYDFEGIEPFTLLLLNSADEICFHELIWDGKKSSLRNVDPAKPQIWSSVTLYEPEVAEARRMWFQQWLTEQPEFPERHITHFHRFGGTGNKSNDVLMNRDNKVLSVSITSIHRSSSETLMQYFDLLSAQEYKIRIM